MLKAEYIEFKTEIFFLLFKQLVYKVKANTILEKLASASIGSYGQEVLLDYVNEAKENLLKIQVFSLPSFSNRLNQTIKELRINFNCCFS